ncbi:MAG: hypothetical protein MJA84_04430, partial [Firmicutes bacterium]|nr:hypothetical protein [Bacillota bacterium]
MSKQNGKPIRSALRDQQHRLSEHAYPGDLADETLQKFNAPSRLRSLRYPALAAAMIGIGLTLAITLLPRNKDTSAPGPVVSIQPA